MTHGYDPVAVWFLRHRETGQEITVSLPAGFIPDEEWELRDEALIMVNPRQDSTHD